MTDLNESIVLLERLLKNFSNYNILERNHTIELVKENLLKTHPKNKSFINFDFSTLNNQSSLRNFIDWLKTFK